MTDTHIRCTGRINMTGGRWNGTGYLWEIWGIFKKPFLRRLFDLVCSGFGLFGLYIIIFMGGLCPVACRSMNFSFFFFSVQPWLDLFYLCFGDLDLIYRTKANANFSTPSFSTIIRLSPLPPSPLYSLLTKQPHQTTSPNNLPKAASSTFPPLNITPKSHPSSPASRSTILLNSSLYKATAKPTTALGSTTTFIR